MYTIKIKSITMQTARIVQAVVLMMIVALAASCAASKEYTSKLFAAHERSGKRQPGNGTPVSGTG